MLSCVGEASLERDRDDEFPLVPVPGPTAATLTRFLAQAGRSLSPMSGTGSIGAQPASRGNRTNWRCLTHTIEHLGLHLGHIEITVDWWRAILEDGEDPYDLSHARPSGVAR